MTGELRDARLFATACPYRPNGGIAPGKVARRSQPQAPTPAHGHLQLRSTNPRTHSSLPILLTSTNMRIPTCLLPAEHPLRVVPTRLQHRRQHARRGHPGARQTCPPSSVARADDRVPPPSCRLHDETPTQLNTSFDTQIRPEAHARIDCTWV